MGGDLMGKGFTSIEIDDRDVQVGLARALGAVEPRARTAGERSGRFLRADMRGRLTRAGRVASRRLWRAVEYKVDVTGNGIDVEVGPRIGDPDVEPYDVVIDEGRGAGKRPPPPGALDDWLQRRGIPEAADYPIRMKIGREGIPATPYIDVSAARTAAVLKEIDALLTEIARMI